MLLSYGAKNFFCFKEWNEISLELNDKVPLEVSKGHPAALTMCLKGANGSGKTNGLKILSFVSDFCVNSFTSYKPTDEISFNTFFRNSDQTELFVKFIIADIEYTYELTLTDIKILEEKIYKKNKRNTLILHRKGNDLIVNKLYSINNQFKLRDNASIISTAFQFEINEIRAFYNFFSNFISNVGYFGLSKNKLSKSLNSINEFYNNNPEHLRFTEQTLKKFDIGLDHIEILKSENSEKGNEYFTVFNYKISDNRNFLLYLDQSSGTKALYELLSTYKTVLDNGGILVLDEFDINLHPDILPHLIEYFESQETNPHNAQFIFTTHNSDIIDTMGKYRTYLFNKEDNESYCYRLDELKGSIIRNDRPISPLYKSGKIGGVPKI